MDDSIQISYHANDSLKSFSFGVRTGIGRLGSPTGAPMAMSAEFYLLGKGSPSFSLQFRPQISDFVIKRSDDSMIRFDSSIPSKTRKKAAILRPKAFPITTKQGGDCRFQARSWRGFFSGAEMCVRTAVPVRYRVVVKLRWGGASDFRRTAKISSFRKIPYLLLSKIGIQHVAVHSKGEERILNDMKINMESSGLVRRELNFLRAETGLSRNDLDQLRRPEIHSGCRNYRCRPDQ
ncbi:hypothetical protein Acr_15g0013610 [Actinidia rufa]|uniref:Uncharacterized protein n=1 Tax=Actinidia rufa TaxID=165716 RepID=A0A7J0FVM4_9ERIC|nr:hypothetical protein Acr_15g0013610 [Actinidia rufa]